MRVSLRPTQQWPGMCGSQGSGCQAGTTARAVGSGTDTCKPSPPSPEALGAPAEGQAKSEEGRALFLASLEPRLQLLGIPR